jgi:hypothetical protein
MKTAQREEAMSIAELAAYRDHAEDISLRQVRMANHRHETILRRRAGQLTLRAVALIANDEVAGGSVGTAGLPV